MLTWSSKNVWVLEPYAERPVPPTPPTAPHVQAFSEGNGNEHRASYKAFAKGIAQLIRSPTMFVAPGANSSYTISARRA